MRAMWVFAAMALILSAWQIKGVEREYNASFWNWSQP
jgi:hypothetical protein